MKRVTQASIAGAAVVLALSLAGCSTAAPQPADTVTATSVEPLAPEVTKAPLAPLTAEEAYGVCDALSLRETSDQVTYTHEPFADSTIVQRPDGWWYVGVEGTTTTDATGQTQVSGDFCLIKGTILDTEVHSLSSQLRSIADFDPQAPLDDEQWGFSGPGGI